MCKRTTIFHVNIVPINGSPPMRNIYKKLFWNYVNSNTVLFENKFKINHIFVPETITCCTINIAIFYIIIICAINEEKPFVQPIHRKFLKYVLKFGYTEKNLSAKPPNITICPQTNWQQLLHWPQA